MNYKQVILVRGDLEMSRGKTCAQVAHASLGSAENASKSKPDWYKSWKAEGQKKVVVKVASEWEMKEFFAAAKELTIPCYLVEDAGLTELEPGTVTALSIGPAPNGMVDGITGKLKLL